MMGAHPFNMPGLNLDQLRQVIGHIEKQIEAYQRIREGLERFRTGQEIPLEPSDEDLSILRATGLNQICGGLELLLDTYIAERQVYLDMQKKVLAQAESGIVTPGPHGVA